MISEARKVKTTAKGGFAVVATGALLFLFHASVPVAQAQSQKDAQKMLKQADANRDGSITRDEILDLRKSIFSRLDRNRDGYVDNSDRPSFFGSQFDKAFARFAPFDTDKDSRISRQELLDGEAPIFEAADTNGDEILSESEVKAMRTSQ